MKEVLTMEKEIPFSLENWIKTEFTKDYNDQVKILDKLGLLELLPGKEAMGILGIDGKEYPIPTKEAIIAEIMKDKEKYETKMKQGFVQIQLTPFASPLEKLTMTLEKCILKHYKDKKLFATKEKPSDPDIELGLDIKQPLFVSREWIDPNQPQGNRGADVTSKCLYYPDNFEKEEHGGKTKLEILQEQAKEPFIGWNVILIEKNPNIPRQGKGKTVGGRKQLEANMKPEQYLELLNTAKQYANEQGLTIEDWLTQFLVYLEKTNQVIDDYAGKGSACYLLASFNKFSRDLGLGFGCWNRNSMQATLDRRRPGSQRDHRGSRAAVEIGNKKT